jgi:TP901 family phage tail tape measure protein
VADTAAILNILLTANTGPANAALAKTQAQLGATGKSATTAGAMMKKAFIGIGVAAGGAAIALYKIGEAFDDASDTIRTRTGATGKELKKLQGNFKDVVSDVPTDFETASKAVAGLNQRLGLTGKPLEEMTKQLTELSRITGTDIDSNVQSITRLFGDWGVATDKQSKKLDGLYRASQETGIQVAELADSMVQFGSPLRQLGLDFETSAAMFARFEKEGVNVQTLMPGLRMALKNFSDPAEDMSKTMKQLGIDLRDGPSAALREVFEALEKAPSDLKANALAFEVFGARAGPDMAAAVREGRFELDKLMATIATGEDTIRKAGEQTMDFSEQWQLFKNNAMVALEPVARRVFDFFGEKMAQITDIISDKKLAWSEKWARLTDLAAEALGAMASKAASLAPKIAEALVKGFIEANIWGKLFLGGLLLKKLVGISVFGSTIGTRIGAAMSAKITASAAKGGVIGTAFTKMGTMAGPLAGAALGLGIIFALSQTKFIKGVADKLTDAFKMTKSVEGAISTQVKEATRAYQQLDDEQKATWRSNIEKLQKAGTITKETADKMTNAFDRIDGKADMLKGGLNTLLDTLKDFRRKDDLDAFEQHFGGMTEGVSAKADRLQDNVLTSLRNIGERGPKIIGNLATRAGANFVGFTNTVGEGIALIRDNVNKGLGSFGVDKLQFTVGTMNAPSTQYAQRGAAISRVPGSGTGDKVPAMLEPGEVVLNRNAVAALGGARKANSINRSIPRFASGGVVQQALGPYTIPPIMYDANHAGSNAHIHADFFTQAQAIAIGKKFQAAGWSVGEYSGGPYGGFGPVTVQHQSPGHYDGTAWDANKSLIETRAETAEAARLLSGAGVVGAIAEKIARVVLGGPDGPFKNMGQNALDSLRKAGNTFLNKQAPRNTTSLDGFTGGGDPAKNMALGQRMLGNDAQWPALRELWIRESGWNHLARNPTSGAYGIPQSLPAEKMASAGPDWLTNPATQIEWGLGYIADRYGTPSSALSFHDANNWYKRGGIIQKLATGGIAGTMSGGSGPTASQPPHPSYDAGGSSVWGNPKEWNKWKRRLDRARDVVAGLDQQIGVANALSTALNGPAGDALSKDEAMGLMLLNEDLHGALGKKADILRAIIPLTEPSKRPRFQNQLRDVVGPLGNTGRLLDVSNEINRFKGVLHELVGSSSVEPGATANEFDQSQSDERANLLQQQVTNLTRLNKVLGAQYGVLGLPYAGGFAQGGVVPGPNGAPAMAMVHGGEVITPPGEGELRVVVEDRRVSVSYENSAGARKVKVVPLPGTRGMV